MIIDFNSEKAKRIARMQLSIDAQRIDVVTPFGIEISREVAEIIRAGVIAGQTTPAIVRRLVADAGMDRRAAMTIARTMAAHIAADARYANIRN